MVAVTVVVHPWGVVTTYFTVAVPAATPVTRPVAFTVAIFVLRLLHVPPEVLLDNCVVDPAVTVVLPVMADNTAGVAMVTFTDPAADVQPFTEDVTV
jgi:hypothetical protein